MDKRSTPAELNMFSKKIDWLIRNTLDSFQDGIIPKC